MTRSVLRRISAFGLVGVLCLTASTLPAEAKAKKKKKPTTTQKVAETVAPTTVALPAETTTTLVATTVPIPSTVPPTTISQAEQIRVGFERMWKPRDIWAFQADVKLSIDTEKLRKSVNSGLKAELYTAADARLMITTADNRLVAIVFALAADPNLIRPEILQASVTSAARGLSDLKVLKVDGGAAVAGIQQGNAIAISAFDNYLIQVVAVDRQRAQDAVFLVTTNMGHNLTE